MPASGSPSDAGELDVDELFRGADIAMHEAKAQSRLSGATARQHQATSSDAITVTDTATTGHR